MTELTWTLTDSALGELVAAFLYEGIPLYAVGGVVRDHLLGRSDALADLDLVIERDALAIARRVADRVGWAYYPLDVTRDLARLVYASAPPLVCDVSGLRGQDLVSDLRARDFTINAMAFALGDDWLRNGTVTLVDVCGGQHDLAAQRLCRVTDESLPSDPIRLLRAVRLSHQFGLTIDEATRAQIIELAPRVVSGSPERIRDEVWKAFTLERPDYVVAELATLGVLDVILPEVTNMVGVSQSAPHHEDVFDHTLSTVRRAAQIRDWLDGKDVDAEPSIAAWQQTLEPWHTELMGYFSDTLSAQRRRSQWLVWHALFHDVGKPHARQAVDNRDGSTRYRFLGHETIGANFAAQRLTEWRFSSSEVAVSKAVVAAHMRPHTLHTGFTGQSLSRRACYRLFRDLGSPHNGETISTVAALDVLLQAVADYLAISTPAIVAGEGLGDWHSYLAHIGDALSFIFAEDSTAQPQPLVNGHHLMAHLQLSPGPQLGQILAQLAEAQVVGEITTLKEGLRLAAELLRVDRD